MQAENAQLETSAAGHRADFERERERADRLMAELLQATAEATAAKEATARLEGEVAALRTAADTVARSKATETARRLGNWLRLWWKQTARLRVGSIPSLSFRSLAEQSWGNND